MRKLSLIALLLSCVPTTPATPTAATCTDAAACCADACAVLARYGCEEARPHRARDCATRCTQVEATGYLSLEPGCVVQHASSLATIRTACGYACKDGTQ